MRASAPSSSSPQKGDASADSLDGVSSLDPVSSLDAVSSLALAPLVDSHCHIVFRNFEDDLDAVVNRWREAGVKALVHACVEPSEIPAIRALADRLPELRYSVGVINPHVTRARTLLKAAGFVRQIRTGVLRESQFPAVMTDDHGTFRKPWGW